MSLSDGAERAIAQLIERRNLHTSLALCLPVPIGYIARSEGWDLYYRDDMTDLYGFAVVDGPIRTITINSEISQAWQRHAIGHEMGHYINRDPGRFHLFHYGQWLVDKMERRASIVAARLLIPEDALREMSTIDEIAVACDVPRDLVELRIVSSGYQPEQVVFVPHWRVA